MADQPENEKDAKPDYLLLIRGNTWRSGMSAQDMQDYTTRWNAWMDGIIKSGRLKGANPLQNRGKLIAGKGGQAIMDGPFPESKEVIGGYFLLDVESEEQAVEIARACPMLDIGMQVEVRPVATSCPLIAHADMLAKLEQIASGARKA